MKQPIIISDLDGTLADVRHRLHLVEYPGQACSDCGGKNSKSCVQCGDMEWDKFKPNWDEFSASCVDDTLIIKTLTVIKALQADIDAQLWIVTARDVSVKPQTIKWLKRHHVLPDQLIMRPIGNYDPDYKLKEGWLTSGLIPAERVFCVFEDRGSVVAMWQRNGLQTYQVLPRNL